MYDQIIVVTSEVVSSKYVIFYIFHRMKVTVINHM